jgi:hypothetical protein
VKDDLLGKKLGLQPTPQIKVLRSLGSETALDFLNALEAERLILVEGQSDARYIQMILDRKYIDRTVNAMFWAFDGIANVLEKIRVYQEVFSQIRNTSTLWDRAVLVLDRDILNDQQRQSLQEELGRLLKIPVFLWHSYTVESSVLTEPPQFAALLRAFAARVGGGEPGRVSSALEEAILEFAAEQLKKVRGEEPGLLEGVHRRLKDLREKLDRLGLNGKAILGPDTAYVTDYQRYATPLLEGGRVFHVADKNDVVRIAQKALAGAGVEVIAENLFGRLLEFARTGAWFDEWDRMCTTVLAEKRKG